MNVPTCAKVVVLSVSLRLFDRQDETYDNVAHLHDASYVATLSDPL